MRLKEIYKVMIDNYPPVKDALEVTTSNDNFFYVPNYVELLNSLNEINSTKLISSEMEELEEKSLLVVYPSNRVKFTADRYKEFSSVLEKIKLKIFTIDNLVNQLYESSDESEDTLVISMPDEPMSFSEMNSISNLLNKTFKLLARFQMFNNEDIKIFDFDKGSNWLLVILGSSLALKTLGDIVFLAQQVKLNGLNRNFLEKQYEALGIAQDDQREFLDMAQKISLNFYEAAAKKAIEQNDLESDPEYVNDMTVAMNQIRELNEMGVAFKAGINSSIETAKSFPPIEQQKALETNKLLSSIMKLPLDKEE